MQYISESKLKIHNQQGSKWPIESKRQHDIHTRVQYQHEQSSKIKLIIGEDLTHFRLLAYLES